MFLNIILIFIIIICAGGIGYIFWRKLPKIRILDVATVPEAQADRLRDRLLFERLKRSATEKSKILKNKSAIITGGLFGVFKKLPKKVFELEKKYQQESQKKNHLLPKEVCGQINLLLTTGMKNLKEENFGEAEKTFIEVISLDAKNVSAYEGLTDLYIAQKEFKQAKETALCVIKLLEKSGKKVTAVENGQELFLYQNGVVLGKAYFSLAEIFHELDQEFIANEFLVKALSVDENNPKYLDKFIESCIILKQKSRALDFIKKLESVNPENQKIQEFYEKLKEL
ncbi:MAG: hypothetical protein WCT18_00085 [Patescibacteria group bacterium]